jgi:hypothetical protein
LRYELAGRRSLRFGVGHAVGVLSALGGLSAMLTAGEAFRRRLLNVIARRWRGSLCLSSSNVKCTGAPSSISFRPDLSAHLEPQSIIEIASDPKIDPSIAR